MSCDIGRTDREQIRSRFNNNDCRKFRPHRPLSTVHRIYICIYMYVHQARCGICTLCPVVEIRSQQEYIQWNKTFRSVEYTSDEDPWIKTSCSTECIPAVICSNNSSYQRYYAAMSLYCNWYVVITGFLKCFMVPWPWFSSYWPGQVGVTIHAVILQLNMNGCMV